MNDLKNLKNSNFDLDLLSRTTDQLFSFGELQKKIDSGKQLRIKYGVDVTAPFLHLGHAVNLWMMRHLQEKGHKVVFLIGDFTTRIGDPTGKSETRPLINRETIDKNAEDFIRQVSTILLTDENVFEVRRNSEWFDKMGTSDFMGLLSMVTHSRMISRDMFQKRIKENKEIYLHEMLYPVLQGYDSFMLNSDITIVGSDQLFNEMMGRFYQEKLGQEQQIIITTRITAGIDGKAKQSKSLNNYIAISDTAREMFGKVMSLPDHLIIDFFEVYTERKSTEIDNYKKEINSGKNPMTFKKELGKAIIERYFDKETAFKEQEWFEEVFSKKSIPDDIKEHSVTADMNMLEVISSTENSLSRSEIKRLITQGAISVNDVKIALEESTLPEDGSILRIGKRGLYKIKRI